MKGRGIAFLIGLLVVALAGALWFWKTRDRDTPATPSMTQRNGSAVVARPAAQAAKQTGRIAVTIVGADDAGPIADATVRFAPDDGEVIAVATDARGVAVAGALPAGRYAISASADGHEPAALAGEHELRAGEHAALTIELARGGRVLAGTVTDVSGGPIAGARIDAAKLGAMARPDRAVATALTGADGKYQLTVAEGQLLVAARSPDYAAQSRHVDVGPSGATADFALVPGGVIEGIVIDERSRTPVPGAIVSARRDSAAILLAETGGAIATAGGDGKFRLTGLRPGAYELGAIGGGRRSKTPTIVGLGIAEQVGDVEILVGTSPVVRGTVVDDAGAPVPAARVMAIGQGDQEVTADDQGAFVFDGLAPGKYALIGSSPEHLGEPSPPIEIEDDDIEDVVVRVRRAAKIAGRVEPPQVCDVELAVDDGPLPGGRGFRPPGLMMRLLAPVVTSSDGKFAIGPLEDGKHTVAARCASGDQGKASADVRPGMPELVVAVKPGASIAGRVVDGAGKPVPGVTVMASAQDGGERTMIVNGVITSGVQALTNGNGAYEVRGLAAGTYRLRALDRGRPMQLIRKPPKVTLAGAERKTGVELAVERPDGVIQGVVLGPDGKPLADAWVSVHEDVEAMFENMAGARDDEPGDRPRTMMMRVEARDDDGGGFGVSAFPPALTDAQGRFEIRNLPKSKYEVTAEAQAGKLRGRLSRVEPDADVTIRAAGVTTLSGTVKSASGATPLFTIELDGPTRAQRTFTDGTFQLGRVDPGAYTVRVTSRDGNAEVKVTVEPGKPASVDITLVANAIVVGTLVDDGGKPVVGVPVTVVPDAGDGSIRIAMTGPPPTSGPDGKFRIEHKAGTAMLVVMTPPSPVTRRGLALEAGKVLDVGQVRVGAAPAPP